MTDKIVVLSTCASAEDAERIARELVLSLNTVRTHTQNLLAKLDTHSALEAITLAMRAGMRPDATPS